MIELTNGEALEIEKALARAVEVDEEGLYPEFQEALDIVRACNVREEQKELEELLDEVEDTSS